MAQRDHDSSSRLPSQYFDSDPTETAEWRESLNSVIDSAGPTRARYLMLELQRLAAERDIRFPRRPADGLPQHHRSGERAGVPGRRIHRTAHPAPTSAGTPRSWSTAHNVLVSASAVTSRATHRRRRSTKSG